VHGAAGDDPSGVRPERSINGRVRIAFLVGILMVDTVGGDPEDRSALKVMAKQFSKQETFVKRFKAASRQQMAIASSNARRLRS